MRMKVAGLGFDGMRCVIGAFFALLVVSVCQLGYAQDTNQASGKRQQETRTVVVVAPSITCFSRFKESLEVNIGGRNDWIQSVKVTPLNKRVILARPKFDFGNDVSIEFQIDKKKEARELARIIVDSRYYSEANLWVLESGHKMKDARSISFGKLLK